MMFRMGYALYAYQIAMAMFLYRESARRGLDFSIVIAAYVLTYRALS